MRDELHRCLVVENINSPPGGWERNAAGLSVWAGETSWISRHGSSTIYWLLGRPNRIFDAKLETGETVPEVEMCVSESFPEKALPDVLFRRKVGNRFSWCHARITDEDVTLLEVAAPATKERNDAFERSLFADGRVRALAQDDGFAKLLYAALCNTTWIRQTERFACSWRYAGGIVADLRERGEEYIDFYCAGGEGVIADVVRIELERLGWTEESD